MRLQERLGGSVLLCGAIWIAPTHLRIFKNRHFRARPFPADYSGRKKDEFVQRFAASFPKALPVQAVAAVLVAIVRPQASRLRRNRDGPR
jgi:hypothetical protein